MRANPKTTLVGRAAFWNVVALLLWLAVCEQGANANPAAGGRGAGTNPAIGVEPVFASGLFTDRLSGLTGAPIPVPDSAYHRPEQVFVLPVLVAPSDWGGWLPDPQQPGLNLDGTPFLAERAVLYERATNNLSVHLQTAPAAPVQCSAAHVNNALQYVPATSPNRALRGPD